MKIKIKRVFETPEKDDGTRILVDRLWPRGIKKEKLKADLWLKEIAPSTELRKWFQHDPEKWPLFKKKYQQELKQAGKAVNILKEYQKKGSLTLLYAAKDELHNNAVVIREFLS